MTTGAVPTSAPAAAELFPRTRRTPLPGGYMGKILKVDLGAGTTEDVNLPEEPILRKYLGGQALGTYILLNMMPPTVRPYDPEAVVVLLTGPLGGNGFTPGGTKTTSVYLSPATGYSLGRAATSGFWAMALKAAGYDGVILTGAAAQPTYLYIDDGRVELRDASFAWGKGVFETENLIREHTGHADVRVASIGPAGEHLVNAAMLVNDFNHNAAHGVGGVLGSKKLKAIAVRGTRRPPVHNRAALLGAAERWRTALEPTSFRNPVMQTLGKPPGAVAFAVGTVTRNNWRSSEITPNMKLEFDSKAIVRRPCFACPQMCPWDYVVQTGPQRGKRQHLNPGTEVYDTFYNLGIDDHETMLALVDIVNDLGIECSHFSNGASLAFEAWEKGLLGPDRTDGLELTWGNVEVTRRLMHMCAYREGWLGNLLADGPKELAEALGGDAPRWAVHLKGGTPGQHDWRPNPGYMLRELVASGGMKSQGGGSGLMSFGPPPDLQYREKWPAPVITEPDGWAHSHFLSEQYKQWVGCMGACWFAMNNMAPDGLLSMVDALSAITGWDLTLDEALLQGHRAAILQSLFGNQHGWQAKDDWEQVGERFLEPVPDGKHKGLGIGKWLPDIVQEYYRDSGRHEITGRPYRHTLEALGMGEFNEWAQP